MVAHHVRAQSASARSTVIRDYGITLEGNMFDKIKETLGGAGDMGELQQVAEGIDFPISKDQLIEQLQRSGVKDDIIARVREVGQEQFKDKNDLLSSVMG